MLPPHRLARPLGSTRLWIALGVLAPLGMLGVSGLMLLDLRRDAWDRAEQTSKNLVQVIERDIARNIEMYDLSLRAVVDNLKAPGLEAVSPALRQLILFDRAATAQDLGAMVVTDEHGDSLVDAEAVPARKATYADREYFRAHKARADLGLVIGRPQLSRLTGARVVALSRRIDKPDGSFGGVVVGTLKLSYFTRLFDRLQLGRDGRIDLYLRDGTRIVRYPSGEADIGRSAAGSPNFEHFVSAESGSFVARSIRDGIERSYAFTRVADLPLVLDVALSTAEIEAAWRGKALIITAVAVMLCGLTVALALLFGRELRRREAMQAELARLSRTDALTGLPNRRAFEAAFAQASRSAERSAKPMSLLIVDADHFKRVNDRYGHPVGDAVLQALARCLAASVHRPPDLVCRIGGEEFALLLPDTDQAGALCIADKVHAAVSTLAIGSVGIGAGAITVSIGLAASVPGSTGKIALVDLYHLADGALYEAKGQGRNRTCCAKPLTGSTAQPARVLQLVTVAKG